MNKIKLVIITPILFLTGCFNSAYDEAKAEVIKAENLAKITNKKYKSTVVESIGDIGNLIDDKVLAGLNDPFKIKNFINPSIPEASKGTCVNGVAPPVPHKRSYLEDYSLSALSFVGMIGQKEPVALVRTPNHGVVSVKIGDYIGNKDGILSHVAQRKMVVVEKVRQGCRWVDLSTAVSLK